jgi:hypothetical protein
MSDLVISGLAKKRDEFVQTIARKRHEIRDAKAAIEKIDAVLEMFDPAAQKRSETLRSGLTRTILETLRAAPTPMTSREIAAAVAERRGEPERARAYLSRTENVLYKQRLRGVLEQVDVGKRAKGWRVASAV